MRCDEESGVRGQKEHKGRGLATVKEFVVRGDSKEKAIDRSDGTGRTGCAEYMAVGEERLELDHHNWAIQDL